MLNLFQFCQVQILWRNNAIYFIINNINNLLNIAPVILQILQSQFQLCKKNNIIMSFVFYLHFKFLLLQLQMMIMWGVNCKLIKGRTQLIKQFAHFNIILFQLPPCQFRLTTFVNLRLILLHTCNITKTTLLIHSLNKEFLRIM